MQNITRWAHPKAPSHPSRLEDSYLTSDDLHATAQLSLYLASCQYVGGIDLYRPSGYIEPILHVEEISLTTDAETYAEFNTVFPNVQEMTLVGYMVFLLSLDT